MLADSSSLFFIVGRGRSGTTLLARLLNRHSAMAVAPEGLFLMNLCGKYARGRWSKRRVEEFCADLLDEKRMRGWQIGGDRLAERLNLLLPRLTYSRVVAEVYATHAEAVGRADIRLIGDKNPHYSLFVPQIRKLIPEARFIHIVRDYRDNVVSFMDVPFDLSDPSALAGRWQLFNAAVLAAEAHCPSQFLRIRYRDLVRQPHAELARICGFLGVGFEAQMVSLQGEEAREDRRWHAKLQRPLNEDSIGQWRDRLSRETVANLEEICGPLGERLGFARALPPGAGSKFAASKGRWLARISVAMERLLFQAPTAPRIALLNLYRDLFRLA